MSTDASEVVKKNCKWREKIVVCLIEHECLHCDDTEWIYMAIHPRHITVVYAVLLVCQIKAYTTIYRVVLNAKVEMDVEVDEVDDEGNEESQKKFAN